MTEIRVEVDLEQPPSLVWRALTEAHLVTDWLSTSRFMVRGDGTFTFEAHDLEGLEDPIEGELVTIEAPHRLVMRCQGTNLHTVVAMTITERAGGSHFTLTQSGFLGPQGTMRRRVLLSTYTSLLEGPLSATLAKIAAEEPGAGEPPAATSQWRNDGGPFNRLPRQANSPSRSAPGLSSQRRSTAGPRPTTSVPGFAAAVLGAHTTGVAKVSEETAPAVAVPVPAQRVASRPAAVRTAWLGDMAVRGGSAVRRGWRWLADARDWSADRRSQAVATGAAALLLLAMAGILIGKTTALHPADPPYTGGDTPPPLQASAPAAAAPPNPTTTTQPVVPAASRSSAPVASATPSPSAPNTVGLAQLSATYRTENLTLTSYRVTITIANPGPSAADDWAVVIVLPLLDLSVRNVDGAVMSRSDLRVIFTPVDATRTIAPSASATFRFEVSGLGVRNRPFTCQINGHACTGIPG
ncbi:SRPBCC domain-containing protein [Dactylosporangium salmoneum]|uniref:CBM2 domain-containing protein n=1 Tax=Dactylosporangium salmoneum TaxID=53361 RepID=A0ABN3HS38_9ACTN